MQTDSNQASTTSSPNITNSFKKESLLIPRNERRKFFLLFTSACIFGWVIGGLFSIEIEQRIQNLLISQFSLETPGLFKTLFKMYFTEVIFALIFASFQAIVLKRYISGWLWLLATTVGWNLSKIISDTWINYISQQASSLYRQPSTSEMILFAALSTAASIFSSLWLGLCQWLVLRRYTTKAWKWIFVPPITFTFISLLIWLLSLAQDLLPEVYSPKIANWGGQGCSALILGIIPAIALCVAKSKTKNQVNSTTDGNQSIL
jgi:hypothetical protein